VDRFTPNRPRRPEEDDDHTDLTTLPVEAGGDRDSGDYTKQTAAVAVVEYALGPGAQLGDYKIEGVIGQGGMGTVYVGVHPLIGKRAAIKVIKKELCADEHAVQRFIDEARVVNEIGHPNIVDVFAFGEMPDGRSYLVMELLKGETMRARMARKRMDLAELAHVLKPLARALEAAHEKDIIHRDLKPDNVFFVDVRGEAPTVKLLDFGIAKLARRDQRVERTATGTMMGTPQYIAPEQARGYAIDHRVDIYSLGCIIFEMLTGQPPFEADNAMDMVAKHLLEPPRAPSAVVPGVPPELDQLVIAMMAKDAAARPPLSRLIDVFEQIAQGSAQQRGYQPRDSAPAVLRPAEVAPGHVAAAAVSASAAMTIGELANARMTSTLTPKAALPDGGPIASAPRRWPVIAAVLAVVLGAAVYFAMRQVMGPDEPAPPRPTEPEPAAAVVPPTPDAAPVAAMPDAAVIAPPPDAAAAAVVPEPPPVHVTPPPPAPTPRPTVLKTPHSTVHKAPTSPKVIVPSDPNALMPGP
jgi:serine/threonine-protein kinase